MRVMYTTNTMTRADIKPALLRPAMYTGEQGDRSTIDYMSDAVAAYLNAKSRINQLR